MSVPMNSKVIESLKKGHFFVENSLTLLARITELSRPRLSKTLDLVNSKDKNTDLEIKHNRTFITENPVLIFQIYPKNVILY